MNLLLKPYQLPSLSLVTFLTCLLLAPQQTSAQNKIAAIARVNEEGINLRWGPTTSAVWELANEYGYTVERYTIVKDSQRVAAANRNLQVSPLLKPASQALWEPLMDQNDYAAIVAQAVYGETFELSDSFDKDVFQIAQKTQERDQRFSFALFACDQSFTTAKLAGLGYTDTQITAGERYLYRIYTHIPEGILRVDTALVYIGAEEVAPLPSIQEFKIVFGDKRAVLSWNKTLTDRFYNAFWIEKSVDGGRSFESITKAPIINAYSNGEGSTGTYFKIDSLSENGVEVAYRIAGINPFGERGAYSEIVTGKGVPRVDAYAAITSHTLPKDGTATIQWEYPKNKEKLIEGFMLQVAPTAKGPFTDVTGEVIAKKERAYTITSPRGTGYYSLALLARGERINSSFPYLIQLADSIPPAAPEAVTASISRQGKVAMQWRANKEDDFWGYRVYRSNFKSAEFSEVTTLPLATPSFEDSLAIDNLTEKIYYKVIAVDKRDNRSEASEIIEVKKPDIIPPARPVIKSIEGTEEGILLKWGNSSSKDVTYHQVYRGVAGTKQWELIGLVNERSFYLDTLTKPGRPYTYTVVAVDDSLLDSDPAKPASASRKAKAATVVYKSLTARAERENERIVLFWKMENTAVAKVKIYRSIGDDPLSLYEVVAEEGAFVDKKVTQNKTYTYQLKAVMKNGLEGGFSEKVGVKY